MKNDFRIEYTAEECVKSNMSTEALKCKRWHFVLHSIPSRILGYWSLAPQRTRHFYKFENDVHVKTNVKHVYKWAIYVMLT